MEVKVDSDRIRSERDRRAWSQEHLASVAGLGLRTVHRIEKTGSASLESMRSLASAFSLQVADLRADSDQAKRGRDIHIQLSLDLPLRLTLVAVSGLLLALHSSGILDFGSGWIDEILIGYVLPGAFVAGAVLWSNLKYRSDLALRAIGFVGAGAFSYLVAAQFFPPSFPL